jgi:hypothetical protein
MAMMLSMEVGGTRTNSPGRRSGSLSRRATLLLRTHCKVAEEMEENVVVVEEEENGKSAAISGETAKAK